MDATLIGGFAPWLQVMPEVGVEPTHPKVHEFESCASANSATPASGLEVYAVAEQMSMLKRFSTGLP